MIELKDARLLMAGRAGVLGLLAEILAEGPGLEEVENLCKYMDDLLESLEFTGGDDDMVSGYEKLKGWYGIAKGLDKKWVGAKLAQEFALLFAAGEDTVERGFPGAERAAGIYEASGYAAEKGLPGEIGVMLDFMAELAEKAAGAQGMAELKKSAASQAAFERDFIMPGISAFCEAMYNKAPDYGVYQYIAFILHGFIVLDVAVLDALDKNTE